MILSSLLALAAGAAISAAPAPVPVPAPERDATAPGAPAAPRQHCSVLRPAAPASAPQPADWRAANAATQRAGGWRAYAQEAAQAPPKAASPCPGARP